MAYYRSYRRRFPYAYGSRYRRVYRRPLRYRRRTPLYKSIRSTKLASIQDTATRRLKYCTTIDYETNVSPYVHTFRATDLYDPDYTGTGHQPLGFDQMMLMYRKFLVLKSKISVIATMVHPDATLDDHPANLLVYKNMTQDIPSTQNDMETIIENGKNYKLSRLIHAKQICKASLVFNLSEFGPYNLDPNQMSGTGSSSPGNYANFYVCLYNPKEDSEFWAATPKFRLEIVIDYVAKFYDPYVMGQS